MLTALRRLVSNDPVPVPYKTLRALRRRKLIAVRYDITAEGRRVLADAVEGDRGKAVSDPGS